MVAPPSPPLPPSPLVERGDQWTAAPTQGFALGYHLSPFQGSLRRIPNPGHLLHRRYLKATFSFAEH
jgi:hypothetical protein